MSKPRREGESVKVVIRCRPINKKEENDGHKICVHMDTKKGVVEVQGGKDGDNTRRFTFDSVYDWKSTQKELYEETFRDLVQSVLEGFNGTIFAYGQTGTGKTHTMQGIKEDNDEAGVIPRSFEHIFTHISRSTDAQYLVRASYLEIYKEDVRDLLHKDQQRRLEIKENPETGVYVNDLSSVLANSNKELFNVMHIGNKNRSVGSTNMNEHSSRSHAIFIVTIECSQEDASGENHIRVGKLNMVDLAGSERQSKTHSEGERLKEATKINLSLSALGNVISALVDGKSTHIPYRDSKLTRLLQDSLGGNSKTVMVANIGPASYNFDETLNTLRYANRAKNIKNKPKINEDPKDALLREYQEKIERLKSLLSQKDGGEGETRPSGKKKKRKRKQRGEGGDDDEDDEEDDEEINAKAYHEQKMAELEKEKQAILGNEGMIHSEKLQLLEKLKKQEQHLMHELTNQQELENQIKAMESKVLRGDKDITEHTREQEAALEQRRKEINEQKRIQREIQQQVVDEDVNLAKVREGKMSLDQEIKTNDQRMKKLKDGIKEIKLELVAMEEEHRREREDLENRQGQLIKDMKFQELILEHFVAAEEREKLQARLELVGSNDDDSAWTLKPLAAADGNNKLQPRPTSAIGGRRPVSRYSRSQANPVSGEWSPRHRSENILLLMPEPPGRTTRDYEPPKIAPQLVAALETALQDEGDIELDGSATVDRPTKSHRNKERISKSSRSNPSATKDREQFPTSRGLVPKHL